MWLEEYHVDGIRFDCTPIHSHHPRFRRQDLPEGWSLLQWINSQVSQKFPGRITIAEDLQNNKWITKDVGPAEPGSARSGTPIRSPHPPGGDHLRG